MWHEIQNEMLEILGHQILRAIIRDVLSSNWYSIIADEATDASLVEQVCILRILDLLHVPYTGVSLRYVDPQTLEIHEDCVGLYATERTNADTIKKTHP